MPSFKEIKDSLTYKDLYILKSCLFVVKNLDELIKNLTELGYDVNRGPKSQRAYLNSMNNFLSILDIDFRNYLYIQQLNCLNNGFLPKYAYLSRSRFSFKNIHMCIGNVRYYSTKRDVSNEVVNKRQQLFQENYNLISEILEKNYNLGSESVQKEIENTLYNQENIFADRKVTENSLKLKFNDSSYEFLASKHEELCKLLKHSNEQVENTKIYSGLYIPLVKKIIKNLGSDKIADLLISYFMEILTKESHTLAKIEVETPGIMSTKSFQDFGKKIFNRYTYSMYIKSEQYIKDNNYTLSNYINFIKNDYKNIYEVNGSFGMMGGYFVWNLVTIDLLYEILDKHPDNSLETVNYLRVHQNVKKKMSIDKIKIYHLPQKLPMVCEPKEWVYSIEDNKIN